MACAGAGGARDTLPVVDEVKAALSRYDTLLSPGMRLEGTLHFPEFRKVLPDFYRQLYEKVSLRVTVTRDRFEVVPHGTNEDLKQMVRDQFLRTEEELREIFLQMMRNDPIHQLYRVGETPQAYEVARTVHAAGRQEYRFVLADVHRPSPRPHPLPETLHFAVNDEGMLESLSVSEGNQIFTVRCRTEARDGRYYFSSLGFILEKEGRRRYRRLDITYAHRDGVVWPSVLTLTEIDEAGRPVPVSGNLNPVSMEFSAVSVSRAQ